MGIINTGISALLASQRALATTSHNVANASKEGYSRQRVELTTHNPQFIGRGFLGQGVYASDIRRIQDEFVDTQLRDYTSAAGRDETRAQYAERIDRLLGDEDTGLAPALGTFFNAANDVASDPTSTVSRQVFLSEAESMVGRFNELSGRINDQRDLINDQIKRNVDEINSLGESLADLNQRIVNGYGVTAGDGSAPNDLLDERGELLRQLAEKVDIKTIEQDNHSVSVFVGSGQPLVMGPTSNTLVAESFGGDPRNWDIGFSNSENSNPVDITRLISGGELGGLLTSRSEILDKAQNDIGQVAVVMGSLMNRQNNLGLDLDGNPGEDLFEISEIFVGADRSNSSINNDPVVAYTPDASSLTASDYRLSYNGTSSEFELVRLDDNKVVDSQPLGTKLIADGIEVDTSTIGAPANNDNWLIQPTRFAAQGLNVLMTDPTKVAATSGALAGPDNTGDAQMLSLSVTDATDTNVEVPAAVVYNDAAQEFTAYSPTYGVGNTGGATIKAFSISDPGVITGTTVTFDAANGVFNLGGGTSVPLDSSGTTTISANGWEMKIRGTPADTDAFDVTFSAAQAYTAPPATTTVSHNGWALEIYDKPADGDVFSVELNKDRPGDNRNMLAMASLSEARVIESSASFADSYNQTLGDIGARTRQAQVSRDSSIALRNDVQTQRDSISGVNLDEEAANLLKYQKAYQAAAQTISVGNATFDYLFAMFR